MNMNRVHCVFNNKYMDKVNDDEEEVEIIIGDYNTESESDSVKLDIKDSPNMYTLLCTNILKSGDCKRKKCTFAHNTEQLCPITCKYDVKCTSKRCSFIHSKESKDDYVKRMGYTNLKPKKQIKCYVINTTEEMALTDFEIALKTGHKYFTIVIKEENSPKPGY